MENCIERSWQELRIPFPSDAGEPVLDISASLLEIHRTNMACGNHALAQLQHFRALHRAPELRLTDEKTLQQRVRLELEGRKPFQGESRCGELVFLAARLPAVAPPPVAPPRQY